MDFFNIFLQHSSTPNILKNMGAGLGFNHVLLLILLE